MPMQPRPRAETRGLSAPRERGGIVIIAVMPGTARYDTIGRGYAGTRREDPDLRTRIHAALGGARTVVNVGAGPGSYEPRARHVVAVEPSEVMAAQRPPELAPAIRATAGALPLRDGAVDAAM